MTYEQRERIFSKEYIAIDEFMELFGLDKSTASRKMSDIRRRSDRLGIQGKVHVQDFFEYYDLNPSDYRPSTSVTAVRAIAQGIEDELAGALKSIFSGGDIGERT